MPNPNAASINLAMNSFVENTNPVPQNGAPDGSYTGVASLAFDLDGNNQPINASGQVAIAGTTISVKRAKNGNQPIPLTFNISCSDGMDYNPQAIVFVQTNQSGDGNGNQNFTDRSPLNQSITVKNQYKHHGNKSGIVGNLAPAWKFYIQIKQMSTHRFGWIDPTVENED
jgi:hypothetical protein